MSEEPGSGGTGGGYRRNWVRYLIIYLLVGGVAYAAIWFFFLKNGGYGS
jgi:hypothetical protein